MAINLLFPSCLYLTNPSFYLAGTAVNIVRGGQGVRPKGNTPFRLQCKEGAFWIHRGSFELVHWMTARTQSSWMRPPSVAFSAPETSANDLEWKNGRAMEEHGAACREWRGSRYSIYLSLTPSNTRSISLFCPRPCSLSLPRSLGPPVYIIRIKKLRNKKLQKLQHRVFPCGPPP